MLGSNLDIMSPQWTNVIFKDRNQAYGAYQLRKNNAANTNRALMIVISLFVFVMAVPTIINRVNHFIPQAPEHYRITEVDNHVYKIEQPKVVPPVQQKQVRPQHEMIKSWPPVVKAGADEDPPTDKQLAKADPGPETMKGNIDAAPVIDEKVGKEEIKGNVTESDSPDKILITSEIAPVYPGGEAAFSKFLSNHIRYPDVAKENNVQGRVFVQFVVEVDGSLSAIKVLRDPGSGLGDEAARVLKMMPHWKPGIQNGRPVRVQFTVPVNFSLAE